MPQGGNQYDNEHIIAAILAAPRAADRPAEETPRILQETLAYLRVTDINPTEEQLDAARKGELGPKAGIWSNR